MTDAARILLQHALAAEWDGFSPATRSAARTFLHDSLAVGVAGRNAPMADAAFAMACGWAGTAGTSMLLGRPGLRLPAPYAAFVNAFQIHAQEYDCVHEPAVAHPMATVAAALLAEAGRSGPYSGSDFLAALVAGVDIVATLGVAAKGRLKFFRPATAGIFGSVAAIARLRRIEIDPACDAFGYALAFASGTMQAHVEGKPALAIQVAAAARSAIEAVDLAMAGFAGPAGSIDGPFGYLTLFEDEVALDAALAELGSIRRIEEVSWKPFPTGRAAHGAIVALQQLMAEQGLDAARLERFVYRAPPLIARLVGRRPFPEMGVAYARLCFAWLGAVTITHGSVGLADFTPSASLTPGCTRWPRDSMWRPMTAPTWRRSFPRQAGRSCATERNCRSVLRSNSGRRRGRSAARSIFPRPKTVWPLAAFSVSTMRSLRQSITSTTQATSRHFSAAYLRVADRSPDRAAGISATSPVLPACLSAVPRRRIRSSIRR